MEQTELKAQLRQIYLTLIEKGYNPLAQITGYLLTEDPTYLTSYNGARSLMEKMDRDQLLEDIVFNYFEYA